MNTVPYNRQAAIAYASKHALAYNPAFGNWKNGGGDCANFVSQCLYAGGLPMKRTGLRQWYYDTPDARYTKATSSWKGAQSLRVFLKYNQEPPQLPIEFLSTPHGLQMGDIVWALKDDGTNKAARAAFHVALVDHVNPDGSIFVYAHTTDTRNEKWAYAKGDTLFGKLSDNILLPEQLSAQETAVSHEDGRPESDVGVRLLRYKPGTKMQKGIDVMNVQARLIQLGFDPGIADGYYGPLTCAAVMEFQRSQGIRLDGIVGPETRVALQTPKGEQI